MIIFIYYLDMKELSEILKCENLYDPYTRKQEILYESLLKSYSPEKLINTLEKKFGSHIIYYTRSNPSEYDKLCVACFMCTPENEKYLRNNKDFQSILNLFNYTFSYSYSLKRNGHTMKACVLEPNIPGDYTKIVYDDWDGIVYHVTHKSKLSSILKKGLKAKDGSKNGYREFDDRIFVTGGDDFESNINIIISDLEYDEDDYVVLKIDLKKNSHKLKFFRDPMQTDCLGLYTREDIDRNCIEVFEYYIPGR